MANPSVRHAARRVFAAVIGTLAIASLALGQTRELLNSERIEHAFGSYAIAVLESTAQLRVSNLYSTEARGPICRTFAVVRYPPEVDPAFAAEHAAILAGGSIGAVFAKAGWRVEKTHEYYGELDAGAKVAALMGVPPQTRLATHVYALDVAKDDRRLRYAMLVEIHHPDYLTKDALETIYGALASRREPNEAVQSLLAVAAAKLAE